MVGLRQPSGAIAGWASCRLRGLSASTGSRRQQVGCGFVRRPVAITYLDRAAFWSLARSRGKFRAGTVLMTLPHQLVSPAGDARHLNPRDRNLYHRLMKTTLNINDQLLADAKALAAQQRTSLTRLIEEGLQLRLRAKVNSAKGGRLPLPVFEGLGGLVQGVDPLSNKALLEALGDDA